VTYISAKMNTSVEICRNNVTRLGLKYDRTVPDLGRTFAINIWGKNLPWHRLKF